MHQKQAFDIFFDVSQVHVMPTQNLEWGLSLKEVACTEFKPESFLLGDQALSCMSELYRWVCEDCRTLNVDHCHWSSVVANAPSFHTI